MSSSGGKRGTGSASVPRVAPQANAVREAPGQQGRLTVTAHLRARLSREANSIASLAYERMVVLDRAGHVLAWKNGSKRSVSNPGVPTANRILMHNHPHGIGTFRTFSPNDVVVASRSKAAMIYVHTEGGNAMLLPRKDGSWPAPGAIRAAINRHYEAVLHEWRHEIFTGTFQARYAQRDDHALHVAWSRFAKEFGLRYVHMNSNHRQWGD